MSARTRNKIVHAQVEPVLEGIDASLLDIVDHVLTKGVVVTGDLVLGVADVDLVYLRLSAVLCAADRVLGGRSRDDRPGKGSQASEGRRRTLLSSPRRAARGRDR